MAILDTIRENLENAGLITADLAKRTAESIRLRDQIRRDKKEIRKLTYEIGQTYLRLHADDYEEVYKEFIDGITAARADIEERLNQLAELKEKQEPVEDISAEEEWDELFDDVTEEISETVEEALPEEAPEPDISEVTDVTDVPEAPAEEEAEAEAAEEM